MLAITSIVLSGMKVTFENCSTIRQVHLSTTLFVRSIKLIESMLATRPNTEENRHGKEQMNTKENKTVSRPRESMLGRKTKYKRYIAHTLNCAH